MVCRMARAPGSAVSRADGVLEGRRDDVRGRALAVWRHAVHPLRLSRGRVRARARRPPRRARDRRDARAARLRRAQHDRALHRDAPSGPSRALEGSRRRALGRKPVVQRVAEARDEAGRVRAGRGHRVAAPEEPERVRRALQRRAQERHEGARARPAVRRLRRRSFTRPTISTRCWRSSRASPPPK